MRYLTANDTKSGSNAVLVLTYYTTVGKKVYEHRKIGEEDWIKTLTPFTQVPYIISTWYDKEQLELLEEQK